MAKYTMLLAEYLERGGQLPASFSLINGFEDIFKKHYCDKEIGFETELLFFMKLDEKADLYMQLYADKLTRLANAYDLFDAGARVRYTTDDRTSENNRTFKGGKQHAETTELPFDSASAEPNVLSDTDEYTNTDDYEGSDNIERRETETGGSLDELQRRVDFVNGKAKSLIEELLLVFKPCFMGVY